GLLSEAATAAATAAFSLRGKGQALEVADVHALEANRGLEIVARLLRGGRVALLLGLLGEELPRLPRRGDLGLPFAAGLALQAHQPRRVVLRARERAARIGEELRIGGRVAGDLVDERLQIAARLGELAQVHLRLRALEPDRSRGRHLVGG